MTLPHRLDQWKSDGLLSAGQHDLLSAIVSRRRFSVHAELNWLLFAGVLFVIAGVSRTIARYFDRLGDVAILLVLTLLLAAALYHVLTRAAPFNATQTESPHFAYDFVLYFACLVYSVEIGYLESRFGIFGTAWNYHLLASAVVFFLAAYRFDNRLVLSLGIAALAGYFGVELSRYRWDLDVALRISALGYAATLMGIGWWLHRAGLKPHFLPTYQHVSVLVSFLAVLSGLAEDPRSLFYIALLAGLTAVSALHGWRQRNLVFVTYAVVGGYVGMSIVLTDLMNPASYFLISGAALVGLLVWVSLRWRQA